VSYAREERTALCALLDEAGPDAPTLCEGWRTRDLAAHLVIRERRPDAAAGVAGGPLARHTRRVQASAASRVPYPRLVELIRTGPPATSVFRIPGVDGRANAVEFFVHHEDVRRASPGWEPRPLSRAVADLLWQRLRIARLLMRRVPVGVELVRDDLPTNPAREQVRIMARARTPVVTVTGNPAELTLWALGRVSAANVKLEGGDADVRRLTESRWHL
jgi:uncharacterized protein (TIGR03085 family)